MKRRTFVSGPAVGSCDTASGLLTDPSESPLTQLWDDWSAIRFDNGAVAGCSPVEAAEGLLVLEGVRRSLAAATAVLTARLAAGRDTRAALSRMTGMSGREARDIAAVARVCETTPLAVQLLQRGEVSAAHVRQLSHVETDNHEELLTVAAGQTVDEFTHTVRRHLVDRDAHKVGGRQRAARSVTFHDRSDGCVGINIVLPPVEGAEFRGVLEQLCDAAYRRDHPERATTVGAFDVEPRTRRLADALVEWIRTGSGQSAKPAVIVTVDAATLAANIVPNTPVPLADAIAMMERANVYAAIRDGTDRAQLQFGLNRRVASPLQRLATAVFHPTCVFPGCDVRLQACHLHHETEFENGGPTNIENLIPLCDSHHRHLHLLNVQLTRNRNGTYDIQNEQEMAKAA